MIRYDVMTTMPKELRRADLERIGRVLAKAERVGNAQVAVRFLGPRAMQSLNLQLMGRNCSTDVLAIPSAEMPMPGGKELPILGDLAVCPSYARHEAKRRGIALSEELKRLLIHGTLHLLGYDHGNEKDEAEMFVLQENVLERAQGL